MKKISLLIFLTGCANTQFVYPPQPICTPVVDNTKIIDARNLSYANTGNNSEMIRCLPTKYLPRYQAFPLYAMRVSFKKDDVIYAGSEFEVTNDTGTNVMIVSVIRLSKELSYYTNQQFLDITEENGFNVTPGMHHGLTTKSGMIKLNHDFDGYMVMFVIAATDAFDDGTLIIEQDYGNLFYFLPKLH